MGNWERRRSRIYREGYSPGLYLVVAGWFALLAAAVLIIFPLSPWHLVIVPFDLTLAAIAWRMSRMGVQLDERGIKVVHMFRTIRIPWRRFRRFVVRPKPSDMLRKTGFAELSDGSMIWIQGMAPWGPLVTKTDDFAVDTMIMEMNHRARELKAHSVDS